MRIHTAHTHAHIERPDVFRLPAGASVRDIVPVTVIRVVPFAVRSCECVFPQNRSLVLYYLCFELHTLPHTSLINPENSSFFNTIHNAAHWQIKADPPSFSAFRWADRCIFRHFSSFRCFATCGARGVTTVCVVVDFLWFVSIFRHRTRLLLLHPRHRRLLPGRLVASDKKSDL